MQLPRRARRVWDALLTGVPFGIFKALTGYYLGLHGHTWIAAPLITWGCLDICTNFLAATLSRRVPYCLLSGVGRAFDRRNRWRHGRRFETLGLAFDSLLSFILQALMIWFHCIPDLGPYRRIWEISVISQVISVGLTRVMLAWGKPPHPGGDG